MAMMRCRDLARHFTRSSLDLTFAVDREVRFLAEAAVIEAKAVIGHELPEWAALAPSTIAQKQRLGYTGQVSDTDPLLRTGKLRESIHSETDTVGIRTVAVVGSDDPVAADQEFGTSRIPARPFIGPTGTSMVARAVPAFGELAVRALTPGSRL